ncbi:hypothetical protein PFBG_02563 [Plasmodium falciparum 7G8]|uniref:Pre-mRNA-splicing factor 18 n=1 Tax=Plasmodium falciparum (isolate 7G8) TaxID=57266 RepID=W7F2H4_PLAF8|nr:hypothetical protein PFBG_02563 [Plasmodium falciparum 7G8]
MLLAIGNAAWPMGVTMVGIHERAGRSKIYASEEDSLDLIEDNIEDEIEKGSDKKDKNNSNVSISEKENNEKGKKIDKEKIIHEWIKRTMKEWNEEIENIVDSKKKIKQATYLQTHKDLKPLEKKLKQKTKIYNVHIIIYSKAIYIIHIYIYMILFFFFFFFFIIIFLKKLNDTLDEKHKKNNADVAHILNDETTRKYIQMIKRLLSFCQRKYCTNPSEAVNLSTIHI